MHRSSIFIISLFLVVKTFQFINSFVFAQILSNDGGSTVIIYSLLFVGGVFLFGLAIKKFLSPERMKYAWVLVILFLILSGFVNPPLAIIFFAGIFLYSLIGVEAQVFRSLNNFKGIPRFVPFIITFLPLLVSYQFPETQVAVPQIFYIVTSVFALLASYSAESYGNTNFIKAKSPSIWFGLVFMAFSIFAYYETIHSGNTLDPELIALFLFFYAGGALVIYSALDIYLRKSN